MAIDPHPPTIPADPGSDPVIDNEIPAYRAISAGAIFSLVLGLIAVFCFTDLWFLLVAGGAVVAGLLAIKKIRQYPDILTGATFARVGIALGLVFGVCSLTREFVGGFMVDLDASRFAERYVEVLKNDPIAMAFYYQQNPDYRNERTPDVVFDEMKKAVGPAQAQMFTEKTGVVQSIKDRLKGKDETVRFAKIESKAADGLTQYANALIEFDGPGSKEFPEKEQFALVQMVKVTSPSGADWVVKDLKFPYKPASAAVELPHKADDGHGH